MTYSRNVHVEIDLGAIAHNVRTLKSMTAPGTLFMAVIKADGYGHGAAAVARTAIGAGADRLGVATIEEAAELRDAGIRDPIHVLSEPPTNAIPAIIELDLVPTITRRDFVVELGTAAARLDRVVRYQLKIDTGMNRIGVPAEDVTALLAGLKGFPGLELDGVMTHFATADVPGDWDFDVQMQRFETTIAQIRTEGIDPGVVNAANSAATILHPNSHFTMVRCGIAIYGLHPWPSTYDRVDLKPAMSVKARISLVKRVGMGDGVSYGLVWRAAAPTMIATVPAGYADGIHRVASGKMQVLIDGKRCEQVGRICMDQFMVELPRGLEARQDDEVVIVGSQGAETLTMDELSTAAGTINYEMACALAMRLGRQYR